VFRTIRISEFGEYAVKKATVRKDSYFDSIFLMSLTQKLKEQAGVVDAVVTMGTDMNLELVRSQGYQGSELDGATPNDLVMAVECVDTAGIDAALQSAADLLSRKTISATASGAVFEPTSFDSAVDELPGANLAVISVPGAYAAREARKALEHVVFRQRESGG